MSQLLLALVALTACASVIPPPAETTDKPMSLLLWSVAPWLTWGQATAEKLITTTLGSCEILHDRRHIASADVVFFLWQWFNETEVPPMPRPRGAMWVYVSHESPADDKRAHPEVVKRMNGQINVLMTYDTAANVSFNYGKTVKLKEPLEERSSELAVVRPGHASINGKIAYAVMVEGNCDAESRNKKVDALKQVLGIDIMGRCGTVKHKECDNRDPYCFEILAKTYYLLLCCI